MVRTILIGKPRWPLVISQLVWLILAFSPLAHGQSFDRRLVSQGRLAFQASCIQCHDADRALEKRKTRADWVSTVRRMARLDDANVRKTDVIPIATYLADRAAPPASSNRPSRFADETDSNGSDISPPAGGGEALSDLAGEIGAGLSTSATISPVWRNGNDNLENPNFFVDAWFGADWQPSGPLRARATACTSCHNDRPGGAGFTLELVEAYASYDLLKKLRGCRDPNPECAPRLDAEIIAGRFIVPFGAYSSMAHPGSQSTVTAPLVYNMGRQVNPDNSRPPVLPMPYSDEGVNFHTKLQYQDFTATLDVYGVNGLQGSGSGVQFTSSRRYSDNNSDVGFGSRATIGNRLVRFGGSVMSGRMQDEGAPNLNYHISGADVTARLFDNQLRLYSEYVIRRNDSAFGPRQISYGTVTEIDALLVEKPNLRMLVRYDTLEHRDFFGSEGIRRFTWGASTTVFGGSTLIINHEHWRFSRYARNTDLLGIRWVTVF